MKKYVERFHSIKQCSYGLFVQEMEENIVIVFIVVILYVLNIYIHKHLF